ncbi:hypothetical protein HPB50_005433 [Hyalomma asiaticum]|uniref:Uncharacterized protein n=1 Tax=Hyalomma asiaticum TaxID=266040 RepID=A0ACB7TFE8_HYAAI|nr:hypothetical protein HPB50_005433 [Hyalomma asiaticum]
MFLHMIAASLDDDVEDFRLERRCLAGMKASESSDFASGSESAASDVAEELRRFLAAAASFLRSPPYFERWYAT